MTPTPLLTIAEDADALAHEVALLIATRIGEAADRFSLNLSGGTTPRRIYERLAVSDLGCPINWQKVNLFWGDERFVPADHEDSN
ncbi:MAG: 6-phosphogluconolactonase, partial [Alphaproteobacteria bacterium]|nr:6-phosphogluconolactonase [Alphaproteobacteria bacterium]